MVPATPVVTSREVDRARVEDVVAVHHVDPFVVGDGAATCAGTNRTRSPTATGSDGSNVMCSSDTMNTWWPSSIDGLTWSTQNAFNPALAIMDSIPCRRADGRLGVDRDGHVGPILERGQTGAVEDLLLARPEQMNGRVDAVPLEE